MAGTSQCSVGLVLKSNCHKLTFTNNIGINFFQDLAPDEQNLVLIIDLCFHHQKFYLEKFPVFQNKCCDLLLVHKRPCKASLREVMLKTIALNNRFNIVPGQKICTRCLVKLKASVEINTDNIDIADDYTNESINKENVFNVQQEADINKNRQEFSDCLSIIGMSPVKLHGKPFANHMSIGKKKLKLYQQF
ncbi:ARL14 effector protein-like [Hydra vulgaris]|uniref:ARL14 effector protein-like n=1 Tax=Hydra vulgaris TaxID=6087 RepID=A0ABM4CQ07_HYDVU